MRINSIDNNVKFGTLHVRNFDALTYKEADILRCKEKLANTKMFDVVIDENGLALKEKMTDILHKIQSFSLLTKENAVGIRMANEDNILYKFKYKSYEKAESVWKKLANISKNKSFLEKYTIIALWLDKRLGKNK